MGSDVIAEMAFLPPAEGGRSGPRGAATPTGSKAETDSEYGFTIAVADRLSIIGPPPEKGDHDTVLAQKDTVEIETMAAFQVMFVVDYP